MKRIKKNVDVRTVLDELPRLAHANSEDRDHHEADDRQRDRVHAPRAHVVAQRVVARRRATQVFGNE